MSSLDKPANEILDLSDGVITQAADETPQEMDGRLDLAARQVGRQLEGLRDWYRRRCDFSVMPGSAALAQLAKDLQWLAIELQMRAEEIEGKAE